LGTGAYGRVYLALDKRSGAHVAIKRTVMPTEDGAFLNPTTLREITILKKLRGHPNIVGCGSLFIFIETRYAHFFLFRFIDCRVPDLSDAEGGGSYTTGDGFSMMNNSPMTYTPPSSSASFGQPDSADKRAVWLIMEYVETDLGRFMKNPAKEWVKGGVPKGLPIDMVKVLLVHIEHGRNLLLTSDAFFCFPFQSFLFQILCGIAYCHANLVLHRDLKPCNILVTDQGKIKITDFGLGRTYNVPMPPYSPGVGIACGFLYTFRLTMASFTTRLSPSCTAPRKSA
jgi:serine/threonine protein kinase